MRGDAALIRCVARRSPSPSSSLGVRCSSASRCSIRSGRSGVVDERPHVGQLPIELGFDDVPGRGLGGLEAQVDVQRFTLIGAYLALVGNAVNAVIARAAYRAQIEATSALLTLEEDQLRITRAQASAGTVPYATC